MNFARPVLCLVTDRRRLAERIGRPVDAPETTEALLTQVAAAAEAGVHLIQVRESHLPDAALVALVRAMAAATARSRARVVVNDRLDVALAAGATGVHLKGVSIQVPDARRLSLPGWLVGRSVHSVEELAGLAVAGADYALFGPVFPTRSKPAGWGSAGLAGLAAAVAASPVPLLGIGGIGPDQAAAVASTGAAGLAAIDAFLPSDRTRIADTVQEAVGRMRMAFDSPTPLT